MAAFVAAPRIRPDELVLCSLSAFFTEDLSTYSKEQAQHYRKWLGERRWRDCQSLSANEIADQIKEVGIKTNILYGELENDMYPQLVSRVKDTAAKLDAHLVEIPNCGHKMRTPEYIAGLCDVVR